MGKLQCPEDVGINGADGGLAPGQEQSSGPLIRMLKEAARTGKPIPPKAVTAIADLLESHKLTGGKRHRPAGARTAAQERIYLAVDRVKEFCEAATRCLAEESHVNLVIAAAFIDDEGVIGWDKLDRVRDLLKQLRAGIGSARLVTKTKCSLVEGAEFLADHSDILQEFELTRKTLKLAVSGQLGFGRRKRRVS